MIREFNTIHEASCAGVEQILKHAGAAVRARGICTIALAGGATPKHMYELLGAPANAAKLQWRQLHFFWGDERWVAPVSPDSNFAMADRTLLSKVDIPADNIHRITTADANPEISASMYEKHLRMFFGDQPGSDLVSHGRGGTVPVFDLILLGMGTDGHTASLFPGSELLAEKEKLVAAVPAGSGSPPVARITLTLPVLNQARNIVFLISGRRKKDILSVILTEPDKAERLYPAARIKPAGNLLWLVALQD